MKISLMSWMSWHTIDGRISNARTHAVIYNWRTNFFLYKNQSIILAGWLAVCPYLRERKEIQFKTIFFQNINRRSLIHSITFSLCHLCQYTHIHLQVCCKIQINSNQLLVYNSIPIWNGWDSICTCYEVPKKIFPTQ